jgi:DNA-binding response OmpR family regulator
VLIVDDERALAVALARLLRLEIEGLHVEVATSGEEALAMVRSRLVRVLIADVGLEGLSGVELVRRMRDEGLLAGAVVILISALGAEELEELSRQAGATRSFAKPVDGRALVEAVRAALV